MACKDRTDHKQVSVSCGAPWEQTCCPCIGRGIDQLPSSGIVVHPGGGCLEAACDRAPGGDSQLSWCNDVCEKTLLVCIS